jgi:L-ascorbate metabolism protein UlaG (beta-lactamase superfamily)
MKIKKLGHCCLLIQSGGLSILTDPGSFSTTQNDVTGIDIVLITHEHADHLHVESLKEVVKNNPNAVVYTNSGVGAKLDEAGITYELLEGIAVKNFTDTNLSLQAYDAKHEEIFEDFGQVQNTGYMISFGGKGEENGENSETARNIFYPGDAYCNPHADVDILAMPVSGGWCRIADAIRYAISVKPKTAFPVHDGGTVPGRLGSLHVAPSKYLSQHGIEFIPMTDGDEKEF